LGGLILRARAGVGPGPARLAVAAAAAAMTLASTGIILDIRIHRSEDMPAAIARLKARLPAGQPLVSLGANVDSRFQYYFGLPIIASRPWPTAGNAGDLEDFCFQTTGAARPPLPFAWEEVAAVSLDRNHHAVPEDVVVVGRRLPPPNP
jgi:hypothetical protein